MKYLNKLTYLFLALIFIAVIFLYFYTKDLDKKISHNIESIFLKNTAFLAKNIEELVKKRVQSKDLLSSLQDNPYIRKELEESLSLLVSPAYRYIYILYRDSKGRYRYLLDGSKEDRGEYGQKLDVDKSYWDKAYEENKEVTIHHKNSRQIWLTHLHPIGYDGKPQAVVAIDFSTDFPINIHESMRPINKTIEAVFLAVSLLLLFLFYQIYYNIKTKKETFLDPLTHLYNRAFLRNFLDTHSLDHYAIAMLDIDHFKKINDNYGHRVGDYVLQEIAKLLQRYLRTQDIIIRYGGEEFLIFIHKERGVSEDDIRNIFERIRKMLESHNFIFDGQKISVTTSIGLLFDAKRFNRPIEAIKYTDKLLYIAKREGRNKVVTKENGKAHSHMEIAEVQKAIDEDRLICLFQPIFDCSSTQPVKYEALVRIVDKGIYITPDKFLSHIAFTSTYISMTGKILDIVFSKIRQKGNHISINLNFSDILDNKIFHEILQQIQHHKDLAKNLTVELLENESLIDKEILNERLELLKSYGIKIAIDDFGSGYANFDLLRSLPIDYIKIDGHLIKDIAHHTKSFQIVKCIARMAKNLQIDTIAEFVESQTIRDMLCAIDISYMQGFHLAKPQLLE